MKNVTKAAERAKKIAAAKKQLAKWQAKDTEIGKKLSEKYELAIIGLEMEEKEGLFVAVGATYPVKDKLKEVGFSFVSGDWVSDVNVDVEIEGIEIIEG